MGTWGPGHLDSDEALDLVGDRSDERIASWLRLAQQPESAQEDEEAAARLWLDFEELRALYRAGLLTAPLPHPDALAELKARYLAAWLEYIPQLGPDDDFTEERRAIIAAGFDELIAWSRDPSGPCSHR